MKLKKANYNTAPRTLRECRKETHEHCHICRRQFSAHTFMTDYELIVAKRAAKKYLPKNEK